MIRTYLFYLLTTSIPIWIVGVPSKNILLKGKGFSYEVYCSKRDSFYLVELRSTIKYYWVGKLVINVQSYTLAEAKDTYLIKTPKGVKFVHKDFINCSLKPAEQDSFIYNRRRSIFESYLFVNAHPYFNAVTIAQNKHPREAFKEYDALGNMGEIIEGYKR
jgi:hypothetical protein